MITALISDVVYGQDGSRFCEIRIIFIYVAFEIEACEGAVPVVRVNYVGVKAEGYDCLHRGSAEEDKPFGIIPIFHSVPIVEGLAVKISVIFDEEELDIFAFFIFKRLRPFLPSIERDFDEFFYDLDFVVVFAHLFGIIGHDDCDGSSSLGKGFGERCGDIGETAGHCERRRLAGQPHDVEFFLGRVFF